MANPMPHVVIVGAGFGGLRAARALANAPVRVTLVDRKNYHLFQPLLYQVAVAGLSPDDIAQPVRKIFRDQKNLEFCLSEVKQIRLEDKVLVTAMQEIPYDYLILSVGGETNYFGIDSVAHNALALKDLEDAVLIRNQILRMFELASLEKDPERSKAMRTFVIVGGGPTGVESAGAISELIRLVLAHDYPNLNFNDVRVILVEATQSLLPGMPEGLTQYTADKLWEKHVEIHFGSAVIGFDGSQVYFKGGEILPACTLIWAAGVRPVSTLDTLGVEQGRLGRVVVEETLQVPGHPEAFVIGDAALLTGPDGRPLPMVAPVAMQQGALAARNILRLIAGKPLQPFVYKDPGSLATIGRNAAVAHLGRWQFTGFLAWVLWLVVHLIQLIGFRNRLVVLINWAWDYFFYDRPLRLILPE
ncbi:MAG TPA: NAD(P)/FAD-dependent oxidoreductase [Anaerolineaceae bacterium]|nr:NAD(P)/FAD-dependent oxidoreductase [Anaerolineaceae bacterium]